MIDCHVHFWSYNQSDFPWIKDDLFSFLAQDLLPEHLWQQMSHHVDRVIAVQA
ncbi:hypothetical protein [Bartonella tamiae]|uniref:Amidohydrolase-related domain-containing protein n=1 Tax=Bartonella tamiae Th239 TaxID=1094558 RepID=J0QSU1_9HYPH|nr:hypothetical protein [Bartonella tamiae]EJF88906.1 hypothetical protein ME5_01457 [Bartonella tamiae Th239]EJF94844.1 hypothetical protein MEG_00425 [Bartonella tamiae Th307]